MCCRILGKKLLLAATAILLLGAILLSYTISPKTPVLPKSDELNEAVIVEHAQTETMVLVGKERSSGQHIITADDSQNMKKQRIRVVHGRKEVTAESDQSIPKAKLNYISASTPTTIPVVSSSRPGELSRAALAIRRIFVPPTYQFSEDVYFHPPRAATLASNRAAANTPRLLFNPAARACSARNDDGVESSSSHDNDGEDGDVPFLMVLVLSSYLDKAAEERQAVRSTYGSVARGRRRWPGKALAAPVGLVFLLGAPPTEADRNRVEAEVSEFRDVLVADFRDSYRNLTLKVLLGLRWVLDSCPGVRFILKTDDDTFVNLPLLTTFLLEQGQGNSIYGHAYLSSVVNRNGRWGVTLREFPFHTYPVYMSGTGYALSRDAAEKVLGAARSVPLIPVEDAFVTGVLAQVAGVLRFSCSGFTSFGEVAPPVCHFVRDRRFVGNQMRAGEKTALWLRLRIDDRRLCGD